MNYSERIARHLKYRGLTAYKFAKICKKPESTISNAMKPNKEPKISTLEIITDNLDITLAQLFDTDGEPINLTKSQQEIVSIWRTLSTEQQNKLMDLLNALVD